MSDTVKLIIEIPKTEYERLVYIDHLKLRGYIEKGIPLDDVKAEFINRYPTNWAGEPELGGASCEFSLCKVLEILDNVSNAESEE